MSRATPPVPITSKKRKMPDVLNPKTRPSRGHTKVFKGGKAMDAAAAFSTRAPSLPANTTVPAPWGAPARI